MDTINDTIEEAKDDVLRPTGVGFLRWLKFMGLYDGDHSRDPEFLDYLLDEYWEDYKRALEYAKEAQERLRRSA